MPTLEDVQKTQGTRLSEVDPWDSYATEMLGERMSPELAAEVAEYAKRRYDDGPVSSQSQEELHRLREENTNGAKEYKWLDAEEYEDEKARVGQPIHSSEFINRLRKAGVQCWYSAHPHPDKLSLLISRNGEERGVACWVQNGWMQELSVMRFDQYGVPLNEKRRGWRTPLLQLILQGFITEEKAHSVFGKPKQTDAYHRYNALLYEARQSKYID